jgi:hypothetical protein
VSTLSESDLLCHCMCIIGIIHHEEREEREELWNGSASHKPKIFLPKPFTWFERLSNSALRASSFLRGAQILSEPNLIIRQDVNSAKKAGLIRLLTVKR